MDESAGRPRARSPAPHSGPRRLRGAARAGALRRLGRPARASRQPLLLLAALRQQGESDLLPARRRQRARAPRPEPLDQRRQRLAGRGMAGVGRQARRLQRQAQQFRRGRHVRARRRLRPAPARRHRGHEVRPRLLDSIGRRFLLHLDSQRPEDSHGRPARLADHPLSQARRRSLQGRRGRGEDRRSAALPACVPLQGRPLARARGRPRLALDRPLLPRPAQAGLELGHARRGAGRDLRRRRARRSVLCAHQRRRAQRPRLRRRPGPSRARRLEGDRARAQGRDAGGQGHRRRRARAHLSRGRGHAHRAALAGGEALARNRAARPRLGPAGRRRGR